MLRREPASQSVYTQLKAAILTGELASGHLDMRALADTLRVSQTPVREALARLAAERLIEFSPHQGYAMPELGADALGDLYAWSGQLVHLALGAVRMPTILGAHAMSRLPWQSKAGGSGAEYARNVCMLFFEIAGSQPNSEITDKLAQCNDRLFRARMCEPSIFPSAHETISELVALWRTPDLAPLPDALHAYHCARIARIGEISRLLAAHART